MKRQIKTQLKPSIKAVLFDVGGVLIGDIDPPTYAEIARVLGVTPQLEKEALEAGMDGLQRGKVSEQEFWSGVAGCLGMAMPPERTRTLWREMIEKRAIDIIHPDLLTSGGIAETKRIADYAERYGLPTALHFAGSPIAFMANLHCAASIPSFIALENHALDLPFWKELVTGLPESLIEEGYVRVPEKPGLGVDLNYEGIKANLRSPGLFEPTDEWNTPKLGFWQPDRRWDK